MSEKKKIQPRIFKGTQDFLPEEMLKKQYLIDKIRAVFMRFGFEPAETPAFEYHEILMGKYGEEGEKLIYPLAYKGGRTLALRYDLTVPLARMTAMHPELPMPFKRYQIQPVWRAEKAQIRQGRFREFYQCDVDTVGTDSLLADAEIIAMTDHCLRALGIENFLTKFSSRKLLYGIARHYGATDETLGEFTRVIDKVDKIGPDAVVNALLDSKNLNQRTLIDTCIEFMVMASDRKKDTKTKLEYLEKTFGKQPEIFAGIAEVRQISAALKSLGVDEARWVFDPALARGLAYYTGPVFETVLPDHPHIGSLAGGGRYDDLIGLYAGRRVPAVGTTIGIDRIITAMTQLGLMPDTGTSTDVLVCLFDEDCAPAALVAAAKLRDAGLNVMNWFEPTKLKKQFNYADKRGIRVVAVLGPDEVARGEITLKDMTTGEQQNVPAPDAADAVKKILDR